MNREIKNSFDYIKAAAVRFQDRVTESYNVYETARKRATAESEAFKDQSGAFERMEKKARAELINAYEKEKAFLQSVFARTVEILEKNLEEYETNMPDADFINRLNMFKEYNIVPTIKEARALLNDAKSSMIAMRIMQRYLEDHDGEIDYKIDGFSSSAEFEKDIELLKPYAEGNFFWKPYDIAEDLNISGMDAAGKAINMSAFDSLINSNFDYISSKWGERVPPYFGQILSIYKDQYKGDEFKSKREWKQDVFDSKNGQIVSKVSNDPQRSIMKPEEDPMYTSKEAAADVVQAYIDDTDARYI